MPVKWRVSEFDVTPTEGCDISHFASQLLRDQHKAKLEITQAQSQQTEGAT